MDDDNTADDSVLEEIANLLRSSMPDKVVTNFIVVAEILEEDSQGLSLAISDTMTPWLAYGMLNSAMGMISSGEFQFPAIEEEGQNG
jgi:hypothetical protein